MNNISTASILICLTVLSGCTYGSQFDCPIGEGNRCASISENVKKIEAGQFDAGTPNTAVEKFYFREDF